MDRRIGRRSGEVDPAGAPRTQAAKRRGPARARRVPPLGRGRHPARRHAPSAPRPCRAPGGILRPVPARPHRL